VQDERTDLVAIVTVRELRHEEDLAMLTLRASVAVTHAAQDIASPTAAMWKAARAMHLRSPFALLSAPSLSLLALAACAHPRAVSPATTFHTATKPARYVAVHVDHLQAGALRGFTAARRAWVDVLARHATTDGRGLYVQTGDSGFLSLRPFSVMADLDHQSSLVSAALAGIDPRDLQRYDESSDTALAPPHRSEIWRYDEDLSYGASDPIAAITAAAWGKMMVEEIDPTPAGEVYNEAWKEIRAVLVAQSYPLVRVTYESTYGTGDVVSFWLARSQEQFLHTPSVEATVANALGADAAEALFAKLHKTVLASDSVDVIPRLDLSTKLL
jgi:hypothetical protein